MANETGEDAERVLNAGRQALLKVKRDAAQVELGKEKSKMIGVANELNRGASKEWKDNAIRQVHKIFDLQVQVDGMNAQIAELKKLSGID